MGKKKISKLSLNAALTASRVVQPSDLLTWDLSVTAVILNAAALGEQRTHSSSKGHNSDNSLRTLNTRYEIARRVKRAKGHYDKWLESTDVTTMALGSARYIVQKAEKTSSSRFGRLMEKALAVIHHHNSDCPDHCTDLIHDGQIVPDVSSVMLSALDSCVSNYARVTLTDPQVLFDATSSSDDNAGLPGIGDDLTTGESFYLPPAGLPRQSAQSWTPSTNIYSLPQFIAHQDESSIIEDMLVDQIMLGDCKTFGEDRIKWLSTHSTGLKMSLSFKRVLQHWSVQEHISQQAITRFLKLMHYYKPLITIHDYIDGTIPHTGRSLLSTSKTAQNERGRRTTRGDCTNFFDEHQCKVRTVFGPGLKSKDLIKVGRYVHFGLETAILGTSIGLIHRYHYRNLLRRIHTVHPLLLPELFLDLTKPESDEPFNRNVWLAWLTQKRQSMKTKEPIVFEVRINADGAQWFESSYVKGTPILGKLTAVRTLSGGQRVKIPYSLGKPFVIGVFEHTAGKPPAHDLLKETIDEMKSLHPDSLLEGGKREGESFAVQVTCFNCDAPMRADLKGSKACSGFYGCERCRTKGVYVPKAKLAIVKETVPQTENSPAAADTTGKDGTPAPTTSTRWVKKLVPIRKGKKKSSKKAQLLPAQEITIVKNGTKRSSQQAQLPTQETSNKRMRRLQEADLGGPLDTDAPVDYASAEQENPDLGFETESPTDVDASDEDEDGGPALGVQTRGAKKKQQEGRSAAIRLHKRHSLVVTRKKKQRTIEADEVTPSTDEEEEEEEETNDKGAGDTTATHEKAKSNGAGDTTAAKTKSTKSGGKRKKTGGSTYFPEIGAERRTDGDWHEYRWPEESGVVCLLFNNEFLISVELLHLIMMSNFSFVILYILLYTT